MSSGTQLRVLTAAILIPLVVAAIWWGPTWLVAVFAALIALIALHEFFLMSAQMGFHPYRVWTSLAAIGIFGQQWFAAQAANTTGPGDLLYRARSLQITLEFFLFIFVMGAVAIVLGTRRPLAEVLPSLSTSAGGLVFIVLPFSSVVRLHGVNVDGPKLLLFTLVAVWVGDTAAYFVGRGFGRWKMSPQLSPNKTWEGAGANFLGALVVGAAFSRWIGISPVHMLAMAALASIAGQAGDLFESALKRSAGVKDSGTILPGHGGVWDRIDALILAAPAVWYYFEWVVMKKF